ncbi:MAG: arsenic efflux protein [Clostridia bacterium]|nr:arsenic efflux protein [Clostridia bacterium]
MTHLLHEIPHILLHTFTDTLKMLPFLVVVYLLIELIEYKAMDKVRAAISNERLGIVSGAALGLFPQCGFSVAAANLYAERLITAGTLAAVFIATSDEALPIVLANPGSAKWFLPLLAIKFFYAIIVGFIVNFIFCLTKLDHVHIHEIHHNSLHVHENGEHHHCAHCDSGRGIISSALTRSLSIFLFLFVTSFILELVIHGIGEDNLSIVLMIDSPLQPLIASLIGLIPNCAASVVLSELFVAGSLSFGSLAAGLCAGAGVGLLVLFRVNHSYKQNLAILGSIYVLSALLGLVLQLFI